jgi:phage tail-like protein
MTTDTLYPLTLFRFQVDFERVSLTDEDKTGPVALCSGAFSDCTGLEATMEPKVIKAGGWNYGAQQRSGPVTFGTVILKRGITTSRDLWTWFSQMNEAGKYAFRLNVTIRVAGPEEDLPGNALTIRLFRALPLKFKCGDLNARATEVGIEELHLAHEGLSIESP